MATLTVVPTPVVALPPVPSTSMTLYALEDALQCFAQTADLVPPEQAEEFAAALTQARSQAAVKRDNVSHWIAQMESQAELAGKEIALLQKRKAVCERAARRMKATIIRIITMLGKDAKGKWPKLEGVTTSLTLKGCVKSVEVTDEFAVPTAYKRATVTLPAELWEQMLDSLDLEMRAQVIEAVRAPRLEVSLSTAKKALDAGVEIPGAKLAGGVFVVRA